MNFGHQDVNSMCASLLKIKAVKDILLARGDKLRFALRVKSFPIMEKVVSCWVMIACRYRILGGST